MWDHRSRTNRRTLLASHADGVMRRDTTHLCLAATSPNRNPDGQPNDICAGQEPNTDREPQTIPALCPLIANVPSNEHSNDTTDWYPEHDTNAAHLALIQTQQVADHASDDRSTKKSKRCARRYVRVHAPTYLQPRQGSGGNGCTSRPIVGREEKSVASYLGHDSSLLPSAQLRGRESHSRTCEVKWVRFSRETSMRYR